MTKKKIRPIWVILSVVFALLLVASIIGASIADSYRYTINGFFGLKDYVLETVETDETIDTEYYKSKYVKKDADGNPIYGDDEIRGYNHQVYDDGALKDAGQALSHDVQQEGTTLLWNHSNKSANTGIPLTMGNNVSLFGISSVKLWCSGVGSGNATQMTYTGLKSNLETQVEGVKKFNVNPKLWNHYLQYRDEFQYERGSETKRYEYKHTYEPAWTAMSTEVKNSFASYDDAAIVFLTRVSGEYIDCYMTGAETDSGDYLGLSSNERKMIQEVINLKKSGTFKKVILMLNTATSLNFKEIMPFKDDIDTCMWIGQGAVYGFDILADVLLGKTVTSGHLPDTYAMNAQSAPAAVNGKASTYTNASQLGLKMKDKFDRTDSQAYYIAYAEGIYVGYKYYETRYEDAVLGRYNATSTAGAVNSTSNWNYGEEVAFPFGFGESLTSFEYSNFNVAKKSNSNDYVATITVKNTGTFTGKDAVQIYIQKPYTAYDKANGIEQAAVNLCGFAKTKALAPEESQTISIDIEADALKTFDANGECTYIREKGDYYFAAGKDAHDAINNILASKGKTPANSSNIMDAEGDASLTKKFTFDRNDFATFSVSSTGYEVTNQFDDTDWNYYRYNTGKDLTYLSRSDWNRTYPKAAFAITASQEIKADLSSANDIEIDPTLKMPTFGASHQYNIADLMGVDYDDPAWDTLLDQLTIEECINLVAKEYSGIPSVPSISSPAANGRDGPLGISASLYVDGVGSRVTTSFPIAPVVAATFNKELVLEVGRIKGENVLHCRSGSNPFHIIYGPGANIHRTAYGGRAYEYYSEDGFLSGQMLCQEVIGIQELGVIPLIKHFAVNDQEDQRWGGGVWANEQSIREVYLEAFRFCVEDGNAKGMMSSFTRFGTKWSGSYYGLMTEVLRNEWGFKGYVVSDCPTLDYMNPVNGLLGGNDTMLNSNDLTARYSVAKENPTVAHALRESVHRVLYTLAGSCAMNGMSGNTRVVPIRVWWENALLGMYIGFSVLTAGSVALIFLNKKKKQIK